MATIQENLENLKKFVSLQKYNYAASEDIKELENQIKSLQDSVILSQLDDFIFEDDCNSEFELGLGKIMIWTDNLSYQEKIQNFIEKGLD